MERYELKRIPLISGSSANTSRVFNKIETTEKIWYVSTDENSSDNIYLFLKNEDPNLFFKGHGGATLPFLLDNGETEDVKGPWKSNPDSLLADTGIDVRDKYLTIGVVGKLRTFGNNGENYIDDVLYKDIDWAIGSFDRVRNIAQQFADDLDITIWYYSQSIDSSSTKSLSPSNSIVIPIIYTTI